MAIKEKEVSPDVLASAEKAQFIENLHIIRQVLEKYGVQYSIVGGLALKAISGEDVDPRRKNGSITDFDAVAFGPDLESIEAALKELSTFKSRDMWPDIGIEPVSFNDNPQQKKLFEMLSSMSVKDGRYFLTYRGTEPIEVPPETMALETRYINGVAFPCFPAKTILYRYLIRGGVVKHKDLAKLEALSEQVYKEMKTAEVTEYYGEQTASEPKYPDDRLYEPYLRFAEAMRSNNILFVAIFDAYWEIDRKFNGALSGSRILYSFISLFRK